MDTLGIVTAFMGIITALQVWELGVLLSLAQRVKRLEVLVNGWKEGWERGEKC